MSAPLQRRMAAERDASLRRVPEPFRGQGDFMAETHRTYSRKRKETAPRGTAHSTRKSDPRPEELLPPPPTPEALSSPARRKAEAEGFALFGKRTWFLVSNGSQFRAIEALDDMPTSGKGQPQWGMVKEMRR